MKWVLIILMLAPAGVWGQMWSDDFEDGDVSDWTFYGDGSWGVVSDGGQCLEQSIVGVSDTWAVPNGFGDASDYVMKARVKVLGFNGDGVVDLLCRMQNGDIHFGIGHTSGLDGIYIYDDNNGVIADSMTYPLALDQWYYCQAELNGDEVKFKVWGDTEPEPAEYQLSAVVTGWSAGNIGVRNSNASARFDYILINPIGVKTPSFTLISAILLSLLIALTGYRFYRRFA